MSDDTRLTTNPRPWVESWNPCPTKNDVVCRTETKINKCSQIRPSHIKLFNYKPNKIQFEASTRFITNQAVRCLTEHLDLKVFVTRSGEDSSSTFNQVAEPRVTTSRVAGQGNGFSAVRYHVTVNKRGFGLAVIL